MFNRYYFLLSLLILLPAVLFSQTPWRSHESRGYELISSGTDVLHLRFDVPAPVFRKNLKGVDGYYDLEIPGCYPALAVGSPNLPSWNRMIELPPGAGWEITINNIVYQNITVPAPFAGKELMPVQPSVSKSTTQELPFVKDEAIYSSDGWFRYDTVNIDDAGIIRNANIARLSFSPVEYNPVTRELRYISSAEVTIRFKGSSETDISMWKEAYASPIMDVSSMTLNGGAFTAQPGSQPGRYVILSDTMFQAALQPFVEWKTQKGFEVIEVYKGAPGVGTTANSMKSYLQGLYNSATPASPAPSYLLIVGDVQQIPAFPGTNGSHITDLYYAEHTGDIYPDMIYGRFSATSAAQLQAQIDKTLHVEKYLMADPSYLQNGILVAGHDATHSSLWANGHMNYVESVYFNSSNNLVSHKYLYPSSSGQTNQIIQKFNEGATIVNYSAHGSTNGWADPSFTSNTVNSLTNIGRYPTVISNACQTNTFGMNQCFGETLLRAPGKGAVGHIGGSGDTYWDEDYHFAVGVGPIILNPTYTQTGPGFYDRLFHTHGESYSEWAVTQGAMVQAGNLAVTQAGSMVNYYWEIYHLMGDPSLMPYLGIPSPIQPGFLNTLPAGLTQIAVQANPYNQVALSYNGVLHGAGITDMYGVVSFDIIPFNQPTTAKLVITGQNQVPYFDSVQFVTPTGPFVLADSVSFVDVTGNNDMLIDVGETISVDFRAKNFTSFSAGNLTAKFVCNDPYITILDSTHTISGLAGLTSNMISTAFSFLVDDFVPDQHYVAGSIIIQESASNFWVTPVSFTINSPEINIHSVTISDQVGNGNGKVEPEEDFEVIVRIRNLGHSTLSALDVILEHNSPYFQVTTASKQIPVFQHGQDYFVVFPAKALQYAIPKGIVVKMTVRSVKNGYGDTLVTYQMLEVIKEDFSGGGFSNFDWQLTGSQPWFITTENPYYGNSCARSGAIPNQSSTEMAVTMPIVTSDTIRFFYKVSSEENYDFLKFSIDGVERGRWSGEKLTWTEVKFPVDSGLKIFEWAYQKDYYWQEGQDCAWIDYIIFPPTSYFSSTNDILKPHFSLNLYPNPTEGSLNVVLDPDMKEDGTIVIMGSDGRVVYRRDFKSFENHIIIDTGSLSQGMYIILVDTQAGMQSRKFIRF